MKERKTEREESTFATQECLDFKMQYSTVQGCHRLWLKQRRLTWQGWRVQVAKNNQGWHAWSFPFLRPTFGSHFTGLLGQTDKSTTIQHNAGKMGVEMSVWRVSCRRIDWAFTHLNTWRTTIATDYILLGFNLVNLICMSSWEQITCVANNWNVITVITILY